MTRNLILPIIIIAALGFAVYANSLGGSFVWDDEFLITDNPVIRSFSSIPAVFSTGLFHSYELGKGSFWRPLQTLTYMIDYKIWKLNPFGYHLTNILLHILAALALFWIILALFADRSNSKLLVAFLATALFVVHPINTQAVTYISGRADILCALFLLLAFGFYIGTDTLFSRVSHRKIGYMSLFFYILALMSKESAVVFPIFLLLYIYSYRQVSNSRAPLRVPYSKAIPFFLIAIAYAISRGTILNFSDGTFLSQTPLYLRLLTTCKNIFAYLGLIVWPVGLHMERDIAFVGSFFEPKVMLSAAALVFIAIWALRNRVKKPHIFFFIGWFLVWLLPASNIIPLNATLAEHWVYLSSMGVFALAAMGMFLIVAGASNLVISNQVRKVKLTNLTWLDITRLVITAGGILALLCSYGWLTVRRNADWRDPLSIYFATKQFAPDNYKVRNNLGRAYLGMNMADKAAEEFEASVRIQPLYAQAHHNLGYVYEIEGLYDKAIAEYNRALELNPNLVKTYENLANLYTKAGDSNKANEMRQQLSLLLSRNRL